MDLQGLLLGVNTSVVREICRLMELTPLEESPPYIPGVANLRGHVLPVVDLSARFGRDPQRYQLTDYVVILSTSVMPAGIIVNEVHDVIHVPSEQVEPSPVSNLGFPISPRFIKRVAKVDESIIMVLNHVDLLSDSELKPSVFLAEGARTALSRTLFCPEASPEEREVFRERARLLLHAPADEGFAGLIPIAVVGLNGEYFGVDVHLVREFTEVSNLTPIPCCPGHVVGNMNLRGNILTLVDLRRLLDMPAARVTPDTKVIVADLDELSAGVVVDQVYDIIYLSPSDIRPTPAAIENNYLEGIAEYGGKVMTVLNLRSVFTSGELSVAEEV